MHYILGRVSPSFPIFLWVTPFWLLSFLVDHIKMDHFREQLIKFYIEQAELEKAKTLCHEWLAEQTSGHRGYRTTFHEYLLRIAQIEEDQLTIQNLSQQLLIDTGKLQYYTIYKTTVADTEWGGAFGELITIAEQDSPHHNLVPQLLVKEELWDELLMLMQSGNRYKIEPYRKYLEPRFPEVVGNIGKPRSTEQKVGLSKVTMFN